MKQREFLERYRASWAVYEQLLESLDRLRGRNAEAGEALSDFPHRYRQLCQQLALARDRSYSPDLVRRLNRLVLRGHQHLYRARPGSLDRVLRFLAVDFPARVRADAAALGMASALLYLPAVVMLIAASEPDLLYAVLDPQQARGYEEMYDPASSHYARERDSDSDFLMFGFYIRNNIGIGFQTFAGGLLFGLGSVFYLVFNGLFLGAVTAHLVAAGFGASFLAFVVTHGAFELTAITLAGAAGLKLGAALIAPGRRSRTAALRRAARESAVLVFGFAAMLLVAAFIEAFWSSSTVVPDAIKYAVGAACWILIALYFLLAGRRRGAG